MYGWFGGCMYEHRAMERTYICNEISFVECSDYKMIFVNHEIMSDQEAFRTGHFIFVARFFLCCSMPGWKILFNYYYFYDLNRNWVRDFGWNYFLWLCSIRMYYYNFFFFILKMPSKFDTPLSYNLLNYFQLRRLRILRCRIMCGNFHRNSYNTQLMHKLISC